jgi:hypothetical protein
MQPQYTACGQEQLLVPLQMDRHELLAKWLQSVTGHPTLPKMLVKTLPRKPGYKISKKNDVQCYQTSCQVSLPPHESPVHQQLCQ